MGKRKSECCERFKKKSKGPCKDCPRFARLGKKARKRLLAKHRK